MVANTNTRLSSRRSFLGAGLAGLAATVGFAGRGRASTLADGYDTVVDVVEEGGDDTGSRSVSGLVDGLLGDDTLVRFPPGRYYLDRKVRHTGFENLGLVGRNATLVPADYHAFRGNDHKLFRLGTPDAPGRGLRVEGFTVDQTAPDTGLRAFEAAVDDGLLVRDVHYEGRHDSGTWGPGLFRITDPDGSGLVERFRAPDGAAGTGESPADHLRRGPTGLLCTWAHEGAITFRDCVLGGFPDNGLYASGGSGDVRVEGGHYRNSGTASVRVGGDDVELEDVTVVVDENPWGINQHGVRLDHGDWIVVDGLEMALPNPSATALELTGGVGSAFVKHSSISIGTDANTGVHVNPETGPTYLLDVGISIDGSANAVQIEGTDAGEVGLVDVAITGDAGGGTMRHAIRCLRDDCYFRGVTVDQPGGNRRRGIGLHGRRSFVYDCDVAVSERGISVADDHAWIEDCRSTSYDEDRASIKLFDGVEHVRLKSNEFPHGIDG